MSASILASLIGASVSVIVIIIDRLQKYSAKARERRASDYDLFIRELQDQLKDKRSEAEQYQQRHDNSQIALDNERALRRAAEDKIVELERVIDHNTEAIERLKFALQVYSESCDSPFSVDLKDT